MLNPLKFLHLDPITQKKIVRFCALKRAYYSFVILVILIGLSLFAELLVNSKALIVYYDGALHFPTYASVKTGDDFGQNYQYEVNYRQLQEQFRQEKKGSFVLMPPIPWNPYEQDFTDDGSFPPHPPSISKKHYLGTDVSGRDVLSRLIYGFRIAIGFAFLTMFICFAIGVSVGSMMGYYGGKFDIISQRFIEIWSMVPTIYVIMIMVSILRPNFMLFVGINVLFGWIGMTWYMRTMTYKEKARDYVMAARAQGASTTRIIFKHILPNTMVMIVTLAPFAIVGNITQLTALDFLGLGLMPPTPSWGELLQQGKSNMDSYWILASVVSAIVLVLTMVTFIGEGIREAFDPKKHTKYI